MTLYPYQRLGAQFLASRQKALLSDGMGLGKTIQAITAAKAIGAKSIAVVCPAIARTMWGRELDRANFRGRRIIDSYDRVSRRRDVQEEIAAMKPDVLVLDEAQFLKNRKAKRTKTVYGQQSGGDGLVQFAQRVWLLSGTPVPNNASELWPHFAALWPELIPARVGGERPQNWYEFVSRFCFYRQHPQYGLQVTGNRNPEELRSLMCQFMLRRCPEEVLTELPPLSWGDVVLDPKQISVELKEFLNSPGYAELAEVLESAIEGEQSFEIPQMATLRKLTGIAKAGAAAELVASELESKTYPKIVIFAWHHEVMDVLQRQLQHFGVVRVDGGTPTRQRCIDTFQNDSTVKVFLGQIRACGTAITLTASNQVAFVEASWTPADNLQAAKRCHRIGQTKLTMVRMFSLAGSIDEVVTRILARKARMTSEIEDGANSK
jgi:SWI/SNF-related matrix-associated actin-dependent regulator 1 of chromatin subfamily A